MRNTVLLSCCLMAGVAAKCLAETDNAIKVFILAGDENVLEQGLVQGRTDGKHEDFYANAQRISGEQKKHVNCSVYQGAYDADAEYDTLTPVATGLVEIGDQRSRRVNPKQRGREPVPYTPFPEEASKDGYTTVLRGYVTVKFPGKYEFLAGDGMSSFNVTTVEGQEVYRKNMGDDQPQVKAVQLEPNKRYAFETIFFKKPGHAFRVPLVNKPGALTTVVAENPKYSFLKDDSWEWVVRYDVVIYDAHPIHNNTEAPAHPITVGVRGLSGPEARDAMGVDLSLSHVLGDAFEEPVMIIRYAKRHPTWFKRGSADLSHNYRPPSSGGGSDLDGSWDVIHFNFGVWDATYRDASSKYFSGVNTTSPEQFEANLRTLVAKMKKTGATIIWGSVTPVWEGEPDKPNGDEDAYNVVAAKVMQENGVIINDLNAEVKRQGAGKSKNVHDVGNLTAKVTGVIREVLSKREHKTKPLPRVLFIGDSITGTYWGGVQKELDGEAVVFKNPGNAEDTWNGLERMDEWLDLKRYLLNGQEYLELVDGVKKVMGDEIERAYPGYKGQRLALSGLFWFQGDADCEYDSKATGYEQNLVNLIQDLRTDFGIADLPVVVTALADDEGQLTGNRKKVFEAQMAVGDNEKYPAFAGSVVSVDTRPMIKPSSQNPGGRDRYHGNAESYLEIGVAMGEAMLKMLE